MERYPRGPRGLTRNQLGGQPCVGSNPTLSVPIGIENTCNLMIAGVFAVSSFLRLLCHQPPPEAELILNGAHT